MLLSFSDSLFLPIQIVAMFPIGDFFSIDGHYRVDLINIVVDFNVLLCNQEIQLIQINHKYYEIKEPDYYVVANKL